jgi:hypothetical protein
MAVPPSEIETNIKHELNSAYNFFRYKLLDPGSKFLYMKDWYRNKLNEILEIQESDTLRREAVLILYSQNVNFQVILYYSMKAMNAKKSYVTEKYSLKDPDEALVQMCVALHEVARMVNNDGLKEIYEFLEEMLSYVSLLSRKLGANIVSAICATGQINYLYTYIVANPAKIWKAISIMLDTATGDEAAMVLARACDRSLVLSIRTGCVEDLIKLLRNNLTNGRFVHACCSMLLMVIQCVRHPADVLQTIRDHAHELVEMIRSDDCKEAVCNCPWFYSKYPGCDGPPPDKPFLSSAKQLKMQTALVERAAEELDKLSKGES